MIFSATKEAEWRIIMPTKKMHNDSARLKITPSQTAKKMFLYPQEIGYLNVDSSYIVSHDYLDSYLLLYVLSGKGKAFYKNNEYSLEYRDLLFVDCKNFHKFHALDKNGWYVLYMYFNGKQASGFYDMIVKNKMPVFKIKSKKTIHAYFWDIINQHKKKSKNAEVLSSLHITRILTEICLLNDEELDSDVEFPDFIDKVFHYIYKHYNQKITLDILAKKFGVSKYHLLREFKRCSGTTINEYILTTRMNKAKSLLRDTDKSVGEISDEIGFCNPSHFIKQFHSREHITPLSYRKQWAK